MAKQKEMIVTIKIMTHKAVLCALGDYLNEIYGDDVINPMDIERLVDTYIEKNKPNVKFFKP